MKHYKMIVKQIDEHTFVEAEIPQNIVDKIRADAIDECIDSVADIIEKMGLVDTMKYGNETKEQQINSYSTMMRYEIANYLEDLLDDLEQLKEDK